jgi:hypothetical protein
MRRFAGFAVAWMLVLVALIALGGGAAVQDVLFAQQLANSRAGQQRAMALAELGLRIGMKQLGDAATPPPDSGALHPGPVPADTVQVQWQPGEAHLPEGFSAGRFIARDYEIRSTGRTVQQDERVLVQGATRLEPASGPP